MRRGSGVSSWLLCHRDLHLPSRDSLLEYRPHACMHPSSSEATLSSLPAKSTCSASGSPRAPLHGTPCGRWALCSPGARTVAHHGCCWRRSVWTIHDLSCPRCCASPRRVCPPPPTSPPPHCPPISPSTAGGRGTCACPATSQARAPAHPPNPHHRRPHRCRHRCPHRHHLPGCGNGSRHHSGTQLVRGGLTAVPVAVCATVCAAILVHGLVYPVASATPLATDVTLRKRRLRFQLLA